MSEEAVLSPGTGVGPAESELQRLKPVRFSRVFVVAEAATYKESRLLTFAPHEERLPVAAVAAAVSSVTATSATSTPATAMAAAPTTPVAASTAASTFALRTRFVHDQRPAEEFPSVESRDDLFRFRVVLDLREAKSARLTGKAIAQQGERIGLHAGLRKQRSDFLFSSLER
jgi:hypothetical protein